MQTKAQQAKHDFSTGLYIEYDAKGNEINYESGKK